MHKKSFLLGVLFTAIAFTSIGALSSQLVLDTFIELGQRRYRDLNNQHMLTEPGSAGWWYFQGRVEARTEDIVWLRGLDVETYNLVQH